MKLTKNFKLSEFTCHCNCDMPEDVLSNIKLLADKLQIIRNTFNASIRINSAYRCPEHNKAIGGVKNSQHTLGKASDIVVSGKTPDETFNYLNDFWQGGLGSYNTFTHIDIRDKRARWNKKH